MDIEFVHIYLAFEEQSGGRNPINASATPKIYATCKRLVEGILKEHAKKRATAGYVANCSPGSLLTKYMLLVICGTLKS